MQANFTRGCWPNDGVADCIISSGEYLRQYKLELAKRLLSERQLPLEKIARMSGFTDSHYLGKLLRRGDAKPS